MWLKHFLNDGTPLAQTLRNVVLVLILDYMFIFSFLGCGLVHHVALSFFSNSVVALEGISSRGWKPQKENGDVTSAVACV